LGELLLHGAVLSLQVLWPVLEWLSALPQPPLTQTMPPQWTLMPALIGALWLLAPRGTPSRWLGLVWLMPLFLFKPQALADGEARFTLLDVGQGLAAVVQTRRHTLVYDTGPRFQSGFDTGRAVVEPFLRRQGIGRVDTLMISHGDIDHIGGARTLMRLLPVGNVYTSVVERFSQDNAARCDSSQQWTWDGVRFRVLHPDIDHYLSEKNENNLSCVLLVETSGGGVLIPGDIEKDGEYALMIQAKKARLDLHAEVLVVPHHGSTTSSTPLFIETVKPDYAVAALGYRNRFGFPKSQVVERYLQRGIQFFDTAQWGAISFVLDKNKEVELADLYRQSHKRYWHSDLTGWY
jgi:competence protein ComEC